MSKSIKFLALFCLSLNLLITTACGDDEPETCTNFPTLGGEVEIDGETLQLSVFQKLATAGGSNFGDNYLFQVGGITADCNTLKTISVDFSVPSGSSASGTYEIKEFFSAGDGDATGSFTTQTVNPITQSLVDMVSGTLIVNDKGDSQYDLDITATLLGGQMISMSIEN